MITEIDKNYIREIINTGKRADGREFYQFRDIEIKKGVVKNAEGSAMVKLGNTEVIVGVKMEIGEPFPDTPDEGVLMVNAELTPMASPEFESGPPDENAIELARVVDRGVRESKAIDLKKLCITPGEKVWIVYVDIHVINDDGNLMDASSIATAAALQDTKIPKLEGDEIKRGEYVGNLELRTIPIACTVVKINDNLLVDPDYEEESVTEGKITIVTISDESLCAMQKSGIGGFAPEEIYKAIDISIEQGNKIRKKYFGE
ncbi:MAG: exosome complex protein Rrp42 [Candidatus Aenigmarchaeota archaeon]|nr:exosome complex protein Rrp42 [Candidatus Aenigmarchaeota archaeon]